ncbi:MAG: hypothetical protein IJ048_02050, partial [Clostridia bacterium]|nr:hypothetical protein [Clostridia bacterium]
MRFDRVLRFAALLALVLFMAGCARRNDTQAVILITPAPTEPAATTVPANPGGSFVATERVNLNV